MNPRNLLKFTRRSSLKSGNVMLGHYKLDNSFPILVKDAIACPRFFFVHYGFGKGNTNHKVLKHGHQVSCIHTNLKQKVKGS